MKKISCALLLLMLACGFTYAKAPVNDKVLKAFAQIFPKVEHPTWYEYDNYYEVYFDNGDVKCRVKYDLDGNILSTRRDYLEAGLCPFLRAKVNEKYPGKKIFGITEVNSGDEMTYLIVLEDDKHWYHIKSDSMGMMSVDQKLNKPTE